MTRKPNKFRALKEIEVKKQKIRLSPYVFHEAGQESEAGYIRGLLKRAESYSSIQDPKLARLLVDDLNSLAEPTVSAALKAKGLI